ASSSSVEVIDELARRAAISAAQQSAVTSASADARQSFGTDSVTQQIDMGFAGDVGIAPTMGHSVPFEGEIINTPPCVTQSKEGRPCPPTTGWLEVPENEEGRRVRAKWSIMFNQNQWWRVVGPVRIR
ncbi:MAG TPA: hypothetical protein VG106_03555, partial [Vicinamibacterales bacterium]|nr:hypothetical protein [Vicinamibacterales bacterium]